MERVELEEKIKEYLAGNTYVFIVEFKKDMHDILNHTNLRYLAVTKTTLDYILKKSNIASCIVSIKEVKEEKNFEPLDVYGWVYRSNGQYWFSKGKHKDFSLYNTYQDTLRVNIDREYTSENEFKNKEVKGKYNMELYNYIRSKNNILSTVYTIFLRATDPRFEKKLKEINEILNARKN